MGPTCCMVGTSLGGEEEGLEGFTEWLCSNLPVYDIPLGTRAVSVSARVSGKVHREFWRRCGHKPGRMSSFTHRPQIDLICSKDFRPGRHEANTGSWQMRILMYLRSQKKICLVTRGKKLAQFPLWENKKHCSE